MHEHGVLDKRCYPRISNGFYLTVFYMGFYNHLTIAYIVFVCVKIFFSCVFIMCHCQNYNLATGGTLLLSTAAKD